MCILIRIYIVRWPPIVPGRVLCGYNDRYKRYKTWIHLNSIYISEAQKRGSRKNRPDRLRVPVNESSETTTFAGLLLTRCRRFFLSILSLRLFPPSSTAAAACWAANDGNRRRSEETALTLLIDFVLGAREESNSKRAQAKANNREERKKSAVFMYDYDKVANWWRYASQYRGELNV